MFWLLFTWTLWSRGELLLLFPNLLQILFLQHGLLPLTLFSWIISVYLLDLYLDITSYCQPSPHTQDMAASLIVTPWAPLHTFILSSASAYCKFSLPFDRRVLDVKDFFSVHWAKHTTSSTNVGEPSFSIPVTTVGISANLLIHSVNPPFCHQTCILLEASLSCLI